MVRWSGIYILDGSESILETNFFSKSICISFSFWVYFRFPDNLPSALLWVMWLTGRLLVLDVLSQDSNLKFKFCSQAMLHLNMLVQNLIIMSQYICTACSHYESCEIITWGSRLEVFPTFFTSVFHFLFSEKMEKQKYLIIVLILS